MSKITPLKAIPLGVGPAPFGGPSGFSSPFGGPPLPLFGGGPIFKLIGVSNLTGVIGIINVFVKLDTYSGRHSIQKFSNSSTSFAPESCLHCSSVFILK